MIYFDVTKAARSRHHSGLQRVSSRLRHELGARVRSVVWEKQTWLDADTQSPAAATPDDWLITPELFSEAERPGWWKLLRQPRSSRYRLAAIFHDAIPLRFPRSTWPQSVARHPEYLKMLSLFDRVLAVSEASRRELEEFWRWQEVTPRATVGRIELGADFLISGKGDDASGPAQESSRHGNLNTARAAPSLLSVGILEPRKNQMLLLDVAEHLIARGVNFELNIVGRVNPHFGKPILKRVQKLAASYSQIRYHGAASDESVAALWSTARASVFPTLAEGCGLPLLESLARGVPCVASDLPVLRESGEGGGCVFAAPNVRVTWLDALAKILMDDVHRETLAAEAKARTLPTWTSAAAQLLTSLR